MNKEYFCVNNNVIVSDENGNQRVTEYYDNLDKVLIQENLIEEIEKRIIKLTSEANKYKHRIFLPILPFGLVVIGILHCFIYDLIFPDPFINYPYNVLGTIISSKNAALLSTTFVCLLIGGLSDINQFRYFKKDKNKGNGIAQELEYLKKRLEEEKQILSKLKEDKSKYYTEMGYAPKKVDDINKLKALRDRLSLLYDLGYNKQKYKRWYQQGILDEKLENNYSYDDIRIIKNHLKNKGKTLVKRD